MALSEKLLKLLDFARRKAKDPEFLARTAHRRAPGAYEVPRSAVAAIGIPV